MRFAPRTTRPGPVAPWVRAAAFTLAEVLAALLFMAIVIPAAVEGLHIASLAGTVAARKGEAAHIYPASSDGPKAPRFAALPEKKGQDSAWTE